MDASKLPCLVLVALQCVYSADIKRSLCLGIPIGFAVTRLGCNFTLSAARAYFQRGYCHYPCDVSIFNLRQEGRYKLSKLVLRQGNQGRQISMKNTCPYDYFVVNGKRFWYAKRNLYVECNTESPGNVPLGGVCSRNKQCNGSLYAGTCESDRCVCDIGYTSHNRTCYPESYFDDMCFSTDKTCKNSTKECKISGNEDVGVCVCKSEYLGFGERCLNGNLRINDTCERSEQCFAVPNSECQNGTCMCRDGYTIVNQTICKQLEMDENLGKAFSQEQANGYGATVGAVLGGLFLGVVLTILVEYVVSKKYKANTKKREETSVTFSRNSMNFAPINEGNRGQPLKNREQNLQRKIVNVPPYAPSVESPTYGNVQESGKSQLKKDDVYSHLHDRESNEPDNFYDHASGTSVQMTEGDDYSHFSAERRNNRIVLSDNDEYAHTEEMKMDNYFILENQT